ncbi:ferric reductase [Achlya hypogyna]|uniref:Ferric reductase n=1 Tax=Achlya hypogyna TaxID=1202772 RepID=A0A1V9YFP6_ACHHY|nr:ferric reductase [Achlya hypogyna]
MGQPIVGFNDVRHEIDSWVQCLDEPTQGHVRDLVMSLPGRVSLVSHIRGDDVDAAPPISPRESISSYWRTHQRQILWLVLYASGNTGAFIYKWMQYPRDAVTGYGLAIARGCAQIVMLNSLLVLLPVCRSVIDFVQRVPTLWRLFPLEQAMVFHKLSGAVLLVAGLVHVAAHVVNVITLYKLPTPMNAVNSRVVEAIPLFRDAKAWPSLWIVLGTIPFWTGAIMLLIMVIAVPLAVLPCVRSRHFNAFWYSHMLFIGFLVLLSIHGATSWFSTAQSYLWIWPPLLLYVLERRLRFAKARRDIVPIADVTFFRDTLALHLVKPPAFAFRPGMFIYLNAPDIAALEWHPFTISSAPDDMYLTLHIRVAGDWTGALYDALSTHSLAQGVFIDGPIGAPATANDQYATIVLVGGGIGVTPFISILRDLIHVWLRHQCRQCAHVAHPTSCATQRVYLYWVARHEESFEWFADTMREIARLDVGGIVEVHCFLTATESNVSVATDTRQTVHLGRPSWPRIFANLAQTHANEAIGVFHCGARLMERHVMNACKRHSDGATTFHFHAEQFE